MPLLYALAGLATLLTLWIGWYANKHGHDGELPVRTAEAIDENGRHFTYVYVDSRDIERYSYQVEEKERVVRELLDG